MSPFGSEIPNKNLRCSQSEHSQLLLYLFQNKRKAECLKKMEQQQLIEAEKKRVAQLRQQQIETEQFTFFEDQLRKQDQIRDQRKCKDGLTDKVSEQTDGSIMTCLPSSKTHPVGNVLAGQAGRNDAATYAGQSPPINRALKPAATLSAVQSEYLISVIL